MSRAGDVWIEYAMACGEIGSMDELLSLLVATVGKLGYDYVNVSIMRDYSLPSAALRFGWINTYPDDWQAYYRERNCIRFDPVARRAHGNASPFFWNDLRQASRLTPKQVRFLDLAQEAGLNNGVGLPFPGARSLHGGVALATSLPNAERVSDLNVLWSFSSLFYKRAKELLAPALRPHSPLVELTPREADILILSAMGESDKLIAARLGISENTVNSHLRIIYRKLDAHNRVQAYSIALKHQLIDAP